MMQNEGILNAAIQCIIYTKRFDVSPAILWKLQKLQKFENPFTLPFPPMDPGDLILIRLFLFILCRLLFYEMLVLYGILLLK